ncbi:MAG: DUF4178 domain-containing protein [Bryobacteraceae bacterium]|nr:DUF4178 domain-containing protein [Bryobacteraceae bacterium]
MGAPATPPSLRSMSCPNCGGTVQIRGMGRAQSVVCIQCLSVLDASSALPRLVQTFQAKQRYQPLIPLGSRGKLRGELFEVIGFQVREMRVEGVAYTWSEYVLFNPYRGFRYLTEYNGHWNDVIVATALPTVKEGKQKVAQFLNENFKHFQSYQATTIFVMGEFPWQVRVGETAQCDDYVHPPRMLSAEKSDNEVVWSIGEYTTGEAIWQGFQLKDAPPAATGIFANQPSPHSGAISRAWRAFAVWLLILLGVQFFFAAIHSNKFVFSRHYRFSQQPGTAVENSFVTEVFDLPGRTSNVEVIIDTDLNNDWTFFNLALINSDTGKAIDFSREVSYYYGRDSDGNWSEGRKRDSVVLPSVPGGRYYLRVEPEPDTSRPIPLNMHYQIQVRRDVTTWIFFLIGAILLLIPPILTTFRSLSFESRRWAESDYSGSGED